MTPWSIPRCFEGQTVAVLASGPSMSQAVADQLHAAGVPCIAINNTHRLAPWAWALYAADPEWWNHHTNRDARAFAGLKVTCRPVQGLLILRTVGNTGYTDEADCVHTYSNSGAQALQIAVKTGAAKVLLCGFDMQGSTHWHGLHPEGLRNTTPEQYARWREVMAPLPGLLADKCDVVNVTPGSAFTGFRMSTLEEELCLVS